MLSTYICQTDSKYKSNVTVLQVYVKQGTHVECAFEMVCCGKALSHALKAPLCQITGEKAWFQDPGILGKHNAGSGVLLVRSKSTSSSPYKGLLG